MRGSASTTSATGATVVHPGTQYAPRLVEELERAGLLREFWTGIAFSDRGSFRRWLGPGRENAFARFAARRVVHGLPRHKLRLRPWTEIIATVRMRHGGELQPVMHARNAAFQRAVPDDALTRSAAVIGFDTSGWILAERCAALRRPFVLDQSIGHPRAKIGIYEKVRKSFPAWSHELETRRPEVLAAEDVEHRLATRVVAASSFTRRTLIEHGVAAEKIVVNPYGVDLARFAPVGRAPAAGRPLRFVFVGQVSARKGIPLLLDVWTRLAPPNSELWLIGHVAPRAQPLVSGLRGVVVKGAVSHRDLPAMLRECDVFVFPSFFEGFGLVLLEAMACGLPIIATDATAAPDIISDGREGFVTAAGDAAALAAAIRTFSRDPRRSTVMGRAARATAETFSWPAYGERWRQTLLALDEPPTAAPSAWAGAANA